MKTAEIRNQSDGQLQDLLIAKRHDLAQIYLDMRTKDVKTTHEIRVIRHQIARILTVLRERKLKQGGV